jgi:excisionase family DNA binding protein
MDCDDKMKKYFAALPVPTLPAESIVLRGMFPAARRYLEEHGCAIVEENGAITVMYPTGTTRTEILPRTMCERYRIVLPDGTELQEARPFLMDGDNGLWVPQEAFKELTTQEAADMLNVPHPYIVKLLEQGDIPFIEVGADSCIRLEDLMEYKERRDAQREKAIAEMAQMCQDWGIYD